MPHLTPSPSQPLSTPSTWHKQPPFVIPGPSFQLGRRSDWDRCPVEVIPAPAAPGHGLRAPGKARTGPNHVTFSPSRLGQKWGTSGSFFPAAREGSASGAGNPASSGDPHSPTSFRLTAPWHQPAWGSCLPHRHTPYAHTSSEYRRHFKLECVLDPNHPLLPPILEMKKASKHRVQGMLRVAERVWGSSAPAEETP